MRLQAWGLMIEGPVVHRRAGAQASKEKHPATFFSDNSPVFSQKYHLKKSL